MSSLSATTCASTTALMPASSPMTSGSMKIGRRHRQGKPRTEFRKTAMPRTVGARSSARTPCRDGDRVFNSRWLGDAPTSAAADRGHDDDLGALRQAGLKRGALAGDEDVDV